MNSNPTANFSSPFFLSPPCRISALFGAETQAMQTVVWILRAIIVVILMWFALKNAQPVKIHGLLDQWWEGPLVFVLLLSFVGGVLIGLLAWVPTVVRQRREIGRLRKTIAQQPAATIAPPEAAGEPPH